MRGNGGKSNWNANGLNIFLGLNGGKRIGADLYTIVKPLPVFKTFLNVCACVYDVFFLI